MGFVAKTYLHLVHLAYAFCLKQITVTYTYIHTLMAYEWCQARCQPAHQEQSGFQYLAKGHLAMQTSWKSNQQPTDNKTLVLPLGHSHLLDLLQPMTTFWRMKYSSPDDMWLNLRWISDSFTEAWDVVQSGALNYCRHGATAKKPSGGHFISCHNCIMYFTSHLLNQTWWQSKGEVYPHVLMVKDYSDTIHELFR